MTEFHVEAVILKDVRKHPNADSLSIAIVHNNYPVIFKTGEHQEGDLVAYVPVDSIVPATEQWAWLAPGGAVLRDRDRRIKAKKLRGVFSMGLIAPLPPEATSRFWREGDDLAAAMGITKYDPDAEIPEELAKPWRTLKRNAPWWKVLFWSIFCFFKLNRFFGPKPPPHAPKLPHLPGYYDIEPFRKYGKSWFDEDELVVVTEKIHGQNASFVHDGKRLHIKSRTQWRRNDPTDGKNTWAKVAKKYDLEKKLAKWPGFMLFGEAYGNNADMAYGVDPAEGDRFAAFDIFDTTTGRWLDWLEFRALCATIDVPTVPVLESFTWAGASSHDRLLTVAEGKTTMGGGHVREGFVVKPTRERRNNRGQRVILKMAGEGYLTRKAA